MSGADRYRVARVIKRGGMAEVLEGQVAGEGGFQRRVAIKRLLDGAEPWVQTAFLDEARILSRLHHANIVAVFDYGLMDGRPFQVLELIDGVDLVEIKREPSPSAELILAIGAEIGRALEYVHEARDERGQPMGIVHRDISPENILLSWAGDVKLCDFGIAFAWIRLEHTRAGVAKGKLPYMAPEQLRGDDVDGRADLFALGCVLHELWTKKSPVERSAAGPNPAAAPSVIDPSLPPDLARIVTRATRQARKDRYASAAELAADCHTALVRRTTQDARAIVKEHISGRAPGEPPAQAPRAAALAELFDLDVMLVQDGGPLRRFESVIHQNPQQSTEEESLPTEIAAQRSLEDAAGDIDRLQGTVLSGYRIREPIAAGASACVFRAVHESLGTPAAVKVLAGPLAKTATRAARLRREAQSLIEIGHENLVSVLGFGVTPGGLPYMIMELVRGRTLQEVIRADAPLAPALAAEITRQIASALAAAHEKGLVHRDLKPANVIVEESDGRPKVKVLDFGFARAPDAGDLTQLTRPGQLLGTPAYMAPEQIVAAHEVGPRADLYALGAVLYAMLAGRPPFVGSIAEVLEQQLARTPPPLPPSRGLEVLAARLLDKDPARRTPGARLVIDDLGRLGFSSTSAAAARSETEIEAVAPTHVPAEPTERSHDLAPTNPLLPRTVIAWRPSRGGVIAAVIAAIGAGVALAVLLSDGADPISSGGEVDVEAVVEPQPLAVAARSRTASATATPPEPATPPATAGEVEILKPVAAPETTKKRPPRPSTAKPSSDDLAALESDVRAALERRGLAEADLDAGELLEPERARWAAARSARDRAGAKAASEQLIERIAALPIDPTMVRRRLGRIKSQLESARAQIPSERADLIEKSYLDLLKRAWDPAEASRAPALLVQAASLERALTQAQRRGPPAAPP